MRVILQPFSTTNLSDTLIGALNGQHGQFHSFQAAVAFAKLSGVQYFEEPLRLFGERGGYIRMAVGIDQFGTSSEALSKLLASVGSSGQIWVNHDSRPYITFHPKLYLFEGTDTALLIIGSGNLTQGGLQTNDEASSVNVLDLSDSDDQATLDEVKSALDGWCNSAEQNVKRLDTDLLQTLISAGLVKSEAQLRIEINVLSETTTEVEGVDTESISPVSNRLFGRNSVQRRRSSKLKPAKVMPVENPMEVETERSELAVIASGFVMVLTQTDVGVGQKTAGTSRRSPEIFIPLAARNEQPGFWGWPDLFTEETAPKGSQVARRTGVRVRLAGDVINLNMMCWYDKSDFRLRSKELRSAGQIGDILRIEKLENASNFDYYAEIVPSGTSHYEEYLALCTNEVRNSTKRWGFYLTD